MGLLSESNCGPSPPKKLYDPPKLLTDVLSLNDWRARPPHLMVWVLYVKVEVLESSSRFCVLPELPICAPPPVNAPCTVIAGMVLSPMLAELARMYWKRVSLMNRGLTTLVSVACTVFSELVWL